MARWRQPARYALYVLFAVALLVAAGGFLAPRRIAVSENVLIQAPVEEVFDRINSLRQWPDWAPWWTRNPFLETTWEGPESGRGARARCTGQEESFTMVITGSAPLQNVFVAMDFGELGQSASTFTMSSNGDATTLTWQFETDFGWNTSRRLFGLLYRHSATEQVGSGLNALREICESRPAGRTGAEADQAPGPR